MTDSTSPFDLVVVGGGPAGTYTAWRAKTGDVAAGSPLPPDPAQRRVLLLESSGRIGGRLDSIVAPGTEGLVAEFGGMGFTDGDTIFSALVRKVFNIPSHSFVVNQNLVYLRGVRLQASALAANPAALPYGLSDAERQIVQGRGPMALVAWAADRLIPGCTSFTTRRQWDEAMAGVTFDGLRLRDIGFWNFLLMNLSNEAFSLVHDSSGHYFEVANWNCAEALPWLFLEGSPYYTLDAGYDTLPQTLAEAYTAAGGKLALDATVRSVMAGPADAGLLVNGGPGQGVAARRVVLALPRRALQRR
ncbi:MAG: FAD-dependent oxidoreductase, partial [Burkholderiales bacterium]|nr:FAD-dependent oxidoreductase [Burkholderiales bacterium]